uniref:DH domain-containing protein n=1 Tax=Wuchereria bancrofti TaxID=6293 RepID=A0A1I8EKI1_WUCBA
MSRCITTRDPTPTSSTSSSMQSTIIPAFITQIFEVNEGVVKNRNGSFTECIIKLTQNGALIRFKGKDFSLNLLESVMVVGEIKERLYISEPTGAFAIECSNSRTLRFLLIKLLTISSFLQSTTTNTSSAIYHLQKEIAKVNESINSLVRSLGSLQSDCELAHDLNDELEMSQLQLFTLKYRLAAISDINFPTPSELLSKISLRTLRHLSSFGGAAICSLHLYFLCKSQFQISKRLWNHQEELMLNVSRLHALFDDYPLHSNNDTINVCDELKLDPEKYYIVRERYDRVRLQERDYRLQKKERSLGLTISAKMCNGGGIKAEVRAIRDKRTCVEVGDLDQENESARSSPTRSIHRNSHLFHQMSRSAYEKPSRRAEYRHTTPIGAISVSHFGEGAEEQLLKTISELVSTEENFVRDVQKLVNQYLKPTNLPLLETADRLLRIQTSFLLSLLDAAGDVARSFTVSQQQLRDSLIRISALFVNKCSKFKVYSDYSAAYLRFQQNKKELNDIVIRLDKLNISGSVERQQGEQALTRMQALAEYVNEMQRLTEQYGRTIEEISSKNGATKVYRILPIVEVEVNESNIQSSQSQYVFIITHIGSSRESVYHLCCCQAEIKNHFIKSVRKAAATLAKEQRRPISGSSQSDGGYSSERHIL